MKRSILQEQSVQIQEMGALRESLRSQNARVDQLEQELSATQRAQEEFNREFGKRSLSSSSSSSSSLFTSNEEKWREKLSKLMQHKIDALHEIENLKSENETLKSTLKSCQTVCTALCKSFFSCCSCLFLPVCFFIQIRCDSQNFTNPLLKVYAAFIYACN